MPIISLREVNFGYTTYPLLQNISIEIEEGEVLQIIGERASGKTTLLKVTATLLLPTEGEVNILGTNVGKLSYSELKKLRLKIGYTPQIPINIANMSIFDNIALPLRYHRILKEKDIKHKVETILHQLNILEYRNERPIKLIEKDRIKIDLARALVIEPRILFLDTIFRELNLEEQLTLLKIIKEFYQQQQNKLTIIVVENSKMLLRNFSKRIIIMKKGKIINICTPTEVLNSTDEYINEIIT